MTRRSPRRPSLFLLLPILFACVAGPGCGGDGTNRVSGKVMFKGQPVPAGKIYFMPDGSKGNTGPTGYANIKDGQFDTAAEGGKGATSGPVLVAIEGLDPAPPARGKKDDPDVTVTLLFPRYETTMEVSGTTTKDFDVPADAAKGPPEPKQTEVIP